MTSADQRVELLRLGTYALTTLRCVFVVLLLLGFVLPWVTPPIPTFYKEWLAVGAFALMLLAPTRCRVRTPIEWIILIVFLGLALLALSRSMFLDAGMLVIAALVCAYAARGAEQWMTPLAIALGTAALVSACLAFFQVFLPHAASIWITRVATPGRASANLGQPNHLATLLVLGMLSWKAMRSAGVVRHVVVVWLSVGILGAAVALTGSRTGGVLLIAVTGAWVSRGDGESRATGLAVWAGFGAALAAQWLASLHGATHFYLLERAHSGSDLSSSRFTVWRETLQIIGAHPFSGVGWGNFNWIWSFTPFSGRPPGFYSNAHNLPLQLAVELGIPIATSICVALLFVGWRISKLPCSTWTAFARLALLVLLIHSGFEYPLWFAYFLLPGAFLLGYAIGQTSAKPQSEIVDGWRRALFAPAALLVLIGAAATASDFEKVKAVFSPSLEEMLSPLPPRIARAQTSWLFGYFGDYAAIMTLGQSGDAVYKRPMHRLISDRLLFSYARELTREGRGEQAAYAYRRLHEFPTPFVEHVFSPCKPIPGSTQRKQSQSADVLAMCAAVEGADKEAELSR